MDQNKLQSLLNGEKADFMVKARRNTPLGKSLYGIGFSIFWLAFTSVFVVAFFGPLFWKGESTFTENGVQVTATLQNLNPLLVPALVIGLFLLVGIGVFAASLFQILQKGKWFIGTPTRLIISGKDSSRSLTWSVFSGDIERKGISENGTMALSLISGQSVRSSGSSSGRERYVPDMIYLTGIEKSDEIAAMIQKRIQENVSPEAIRESASDSF